MKYYDESGNEITNPDLTKGSIITYLLYKKGGI